MAEQTTEHPSDASTAYPPAPGQMVGQMWLSLSRLREPVDELRPAGIYGTAFVSYEPGSPLTYSELLVARPIPARGDWHDAAPYCSVMRLPRLVSTRIAPVW